MKSDEKKPFSHPRWNDTSLPIVTGHRELTEQEKEDAELFMKRIMEKRKNIKRKS